MFLLTPISTRFELREKTEANQQQMVASAKCKRSWRNSGVRCSVAGARSTKNEFGAGARRDQDVASVWEGCRVVPQVEVVQVLTAAEVIQIGDMGFPRFVNLC